MATPGSLEIRSLRSVERHCFARRIVPLHGGEIETAATTAENGVSRFGARVRQYLPTRRTARTVPGFSGDATADGSLANVGVHVREMSLSVARFRRFAVDESHSRCRVRYRRSGRQHVQSVGLRPDGYCRSNYDDLHETGGICWSFCGFSGDAGTVADGRACAGKTGMAGLANGARHTSNRRSTTRPLQRSIDQLAGVRSQFCSLLWRLFVDSRAVTSIGLGGKMGTVSGSTALRRSHRRLLCLRLHKSTRRVPSSTAGSTNQLQRNGAITVGRRGMASVDQRIGPSTGNCYCWFFRLRPGLRIDETARRSTRTQKFRQMVIHFDTFVFLLL